MQPFDICHVRRKTVSRVDNRPLGNSPLDSRKIRFSKNLSIVTIHIVNPLTPQLKAIKIDTRGVGVSSIPLNWK